MSSEFYDLPKINPDLMGDSVHTAAVAEPDPVRDSAVVAKKMTKLTLKKKILFGAGGLVGLITLITLLLVSGIIPMPPDPDAQQARQPLPAVAAVDHGSQPAGHSAVPPSQVETKATASEPTQSSEQPPEQNQTVMGDTRVEKTASEASAQTNNAVSEPRDTQIVTAQSTARSDYVGPAMAMSGRLEDQNARLVKIENQLLLLNSQLLTLRAELAVVNKTVSPSQVIKPNNLAKASNSKKVAISANNAKQSASRSSATAKSIDDQVGVITESKSSSDASGKVQILGITSKAGGGYVVLSFAGIKKRYEKGDSVSALGRIGDFGSDNGVPYVEIAGVTYR